MRIQRFSFESLHSFDTEYTDGSAASVLGKKPQAHQELKNPPAPVFTRQDMEAAEKSAYAIGYEAGKTAMANQAEDETLLREKSIQSALSHIATQVTLMAEFHRDFLESRKKELSQLTLAAAKKVAGAALACDPLPEIEYMIAQCLEELVGNPAIHIRIHPELVDVLQQRLGKIPRENLHDANLEVKADDDIPKGDCRVEWKNGMAERNIERLWQQLQTIIDNTTDTKIMEKLKSTDSQNFSGDEEDSNQSSPSLYIAN